MYRYSVIIPVYNAEKTIEKCLNSLLCQECKHAEIIIINDGSTDSSGDICRTYATKYSSVRYFEQENGGVSSARNQGIKNATGFYVLFVDSDDYVTENYFDILDSAIAAEKADFYQFSYMVESKFKTSKEMKEHVYLQERKTVLPYLINEICRKRINSPWGKVYKRSILHDYGVYFPLGVSNSEDRVFNIHYSFYIHSFVVSSQITNIINVTNEGSLSRKKADDLDKQFKLAEVYLDNALKYAQIPEYEKRMYSEARNFSKCISIYREAKTLRKENVSWPKRQIVLWKKCRDINKNHYHYPKIWYCFLATAPIQLWLTPVIDLFAKKLNR